MIKYSAESYHEASKGRLDAAVAANVKEVND
jgi:hypothetical protein